MEPCSDHYRQVRVMERTVGQLGTRQTDKEEKGGILVTKVSGLR